jgi:hypothetical protein
MEDRIGLVTDAVSKPLMEAELARAAAAGEGRDPSLVVARQMLTFIRDDRGRTKPEAGKLSDRLMASWGRR